MGCNGPMHHCDDGWQTVELGAIAAGSLMIEGEVKGLSAEDAGAMSKNLAENGPPLDKAKWGECSVALGKVTNVLHDVTAMACHGMQGHAGRVLRRARQGDGRSGRVEVAERRTG